MVARDDRGDKRRALFSKNRGNRARKSGNLLIGLCLSSLTRPAQEERFINENSKNDSNTENNLSEMVAIEHVCEPRTSV